MESNQKAKCKQQNCGQGTSRQRRFSIYGVPNAYETLCKPYLWMLTPVYEIDFLKF